jgi:hypothetical protein
VYQELNLFYMQDERDDHIATCYGEYVTIIRARMVPNGPREYEERLVKMLSLCPNVQSLGLYYHSNFHSIGQSPSSEPPLLRRVLSSIEEGKLRSLGFYSPNTYSSWGEEEKSSDRSLLYDIATSDQAKVIKRLDLYFGSLSWKIFALIRTQFTDLEALTFREALDRRVGPVWLPSQKDEPYWSSYSNLTSLQLIGCSNVCPPIIPELIRQFPSLEYFLISACGDSSPSAQHGREKGWSSQSDGWWNQRKPLKGIHIEHMLTWEMLLMGTIPALEVTAVSLHAAHLANTFIGDKEVFPHLRVLRAEPLESRAFDGYERLMVERKSETELKQVCAARKIEFRRDATYFIHNRYGWW